MTDMHREGIVGVRARRLTTVVISVATMVAACSSGNATTSSTRPSTVGKCVVGVSWSSHVGERWVKWDEPAMKRAIAAGGGTYVSTDAQSSAATQAINMASLISQGAKVLVVLAQDGTAIKPSVAEAISNGVPVIAYERLIEDPGAAKNIAGATPFKTTGGVTVTSIVLKPTPVTTANLSVVLDAGWIDKATLCHGVASGAVTACA